MRCIFRAALAVLFLAAVATGDYTFQTLPSSGEFLQTSAGLSVRWEMRPGESPDSPGVAVPATVSVSLGYKDSADKPVVLFPPIGDNVPVAGLQFSWSTMDFNSFANGPVPPRDANTNWFILLSDQSTGYKSNGQLFHLIGAANVNPVTSSGTNSLAPPTSATATLVSSARLTSSTAVPSASSSTGLPSAKPTSAASTAGGSSVSSIRPSTSSTTSTPAASGGSSVAAKSFVLLGAAIAGAALLRIC